MEEEVDRVVICCLMLSIKSLRKEKVKEIKGVRGIKEVRGDKTTIIIITGDEVHVCCKSMAWTTTSLTISNSFQ